MMKKFKFRMTAAWFALAVFTLFVTVSTEIQAQTPAVDPAATKILKKMTDYLGGLKQFSVHTRNNLEDLLESGHRVDFQISADVTISRPNKLHAERKGDQVDQTFTMTVKR